MADSTREDRNEVRPLRLEKLVEAGGYTVAEWSPDEHHRGGPTEVHLVIEIPDHDDRGLQLALRLKSRRGITQLIEVLTERRDSVWKLQ